MVLCTLSADNEDKVRKRLEGNNICYMIQYLSNNKINVFFGKEECIIVVREMCNDRPLNKLTPEEDFILGTLLGYSVCEQCTRYCKRMKKATCVA